MAKLELGENDIILSVSSSKTLQTCLRKYFFQSIMRIEPNRRPSPLQIGGAFHLGTEGFYNKLEPKAVLNLIRDQYNLEEQGCDDEWFIAQCEENRALTLAMMVGYMVHYRNDEFIDMKPEAEFTVLLHEEKDFRVFIRGFIDGVYKMRGPNGKESWWLLENKTHGENDIDKYKKKLAMDIQSTIYLFAGETEYEIPLSGVLYNMVKKAQLKQGAKESPRQFYERLKLDYISRPDNYFKRHYIYRSPEEKDELKFELVEMARDLLEKKKRAKVIGDFAAFYRNTNACAGFGMCPFLSICSNPASAEQTIELGFKTREMAS